MKADVGYRSVIFFLVKCKSYLIVIVKCVSLTVQTDIIIANTPPAGAG